MQSILPSWWALRYLKARGLTTAFPRILCTVTFEYNSVLACGVPSAEFGDHIFVVLLTNATEDVLDWTSVFQP